MASPTIPPQYRDLFQKKAFAHLATLMADGTPHVTPVWVDYDGTYILIDGWQGGTKDKNMQRDPRVSLTITDPDNPYRYLEIRGRVKEYTEEGADAVLDALARRYLGTERYPWHRGETRVLYKILPERTLGRG